MGSSLAVFFFILLACPLAIPVASIPSTALGTIPPQASPEATNFDGKVTYKGDWTWTDRPEELPFEFVSRKEGGSIVFQLTFSPTEKEGMHNVYGKLMARNGKYATDYDATMLLEGVYMENLGRLAAVAEPLVAVELPHNHKINSTRNGRASVTNRGRIRRAESREEDIVAQSAALRKAAEILLGLSDSDAEALLLLQEAEEKKERGQQVDKNTNNSRDYDNNSGLVLSSLAEKNATCRFSLELNFHRDEKTTTTTATAISSSFSKDRVQNSNDVVHKTLLLPLPPEALTGTFPTSASSGQPAASISVSGHLRGLRCGIAIAIAAAPADPKAYAAKATRYSMMMTLVAVLQIALTLRQLEAGSFSRLSLLSLGQQAVQDAFLCLMHLTLAIIVGPLFNSFATLACVQFCLFGIFELRMMLLTWRARRRGLVDPWVLQRELTSLYARFYAAVLGSLILCYNFRRYMRVITLLLHGFWVPQILRSGKTDTRPPLLPSYVIGMSLTRLVLPLYLFACPSNLLNVAPSLGMCVALVIIVSGQAVTVVLQSLSGPRFGPRWFIPRRFLPAKYDYYRGCSRKGVGDIETGEAEDCVICMNAIDLDIGGGSGGNAATMVAPCDHRFHSRCLMRWMAVKMECPTCRRPLPPP